MRSADGEQKKPPARVTVAVESKILASREEAAQMLSISQRALDYLIATRRLPTRRIGGRALIPVSELRKYARTDKPERIVDRRYRARIGCVVASGIEVKAEPLTNLRFGKPAHASG